ncbi:hypothetical protein GCM10011386_34370 [Parapedobacter defluvii]|uniref:HTH luxR-type domain-containing protein n=1 Tax=Parapedobacter defluvii TaxID=2045106 RepID=A0ABQ1MFQ1_9SPHI|nr:LuxR C-terminal-related transcriptional regulator [Parapedobacter defluvii]GGC39427.1 hypothetical protein GCM10011386_34370 [Parapedobacter defluvii]
MKRAIYLLFLIWLLTSAFLPGPYVYAQAGDFPAAQIEQLFFTPMQSNENLSVAEDNQGNNWIRGYIPADLLGVPIIFQIPSARVHDYDLYLRQDGEWKRMLRNTDSRSGHFKSRFPQYTLIPSDSLYYLSFGAHPPQTLQVQLGERNQFSSNESFDLFRIGLYYGLALMSVIFNLVFFLIFKDRRFITYCILLLTTFLSFFYEDGMFHYFSDGRLVIDHLIVFNSAVSSIISVPFTYYFLDLSIPFKRFGKWFLGISALLLASSLVYAITDSYAAQIFTYSLCFLFPVCCLYLALRRFRHDVYARFLVLSFSFVVIIGLLYVLYTRIDSSTYSPFGISTFRLVSAIEIIAISFAIIFKAKSLQHENDRYREELNNYLKTLEIKEVEERYRKNGAAHAETQSDTKEKLVDALKAQYELTDREIEVLLCIWDGLTNKEIAEQLFVTLSTTKYHVSNLYLKLDVKNRNQAQVLQKSLKA